MQLPLNEEARVPRGAAMMDKVQKFGWKTVDHPGVPYLAAKTDLQIDPTYQRTMISEPRVLQIAQAWSWIACGSLIVAERKDGGLFVIDGQHRSVAAMRRSDIQELPCLIFKSTGAEEEALAFVRANCVRGAVTPFDRLRALLAASDQVAIDVVALLQSQGYEASRAEKMHGIRCVSKLMGWMKSDRGVLQNVWPLVAQLHDGLTIKEAVFAAIMYIGKFGSDDITTEQWRERFLKVGLHRISDAIDRGRSLYAQGGARIMAISVLEVVNKGLRASSKLTLMSPMVDDE